MPATVKQNYLRRRGWKDLIFLAVVLVLALSVRRWTFPNDVEKWKARPLLGPHHGPLSQRVVGQNGPVPCFFFVPTTEDDQPADSGTVGDCLMLVPDGRKLNLFEVDLWTGDFVPIATDDYVLDTIPLAFTRVVYVLDDWAKRNLIFLRHVYDPYLFGDRFPYTYCEWLLPDNMHVYYRRISSGTDYSDAVYESTKNFPIFGGSRINWNGWGWDLALQDGATYLSPEAYSGKRPQQGSLVGVFDEKGNEVRLSRKANGDLTEIKSPRGRWISLIYDDEGRITRIKDSAGNLVEYEYDPQNRLIVVSYSGGRRVTYTYNSANRVVEVQDPPGVSVLKADYDSYGRVIRQTLPGGSTYSFRYGPIQDGMNAWAEILNPQSELTKITLLRKSYSIEK